MTSIKWQLKSNGSQKDIKLLLARTPKSQLFYILLKRGGLYRTVTYLAMDRKGVKLFLSHDFHWIYNNWFRKNVHHEEFISMEACSTKSTMTKKLSSFQNFLWFLFHLKALSSVWTSSTGSIEKNMSSSSFISADSQRCFAAKNFKLEPLAFKN